MNLNDKKFEIEGYDGYLFEDKDVKEFIKKLNLFILGEYRKEKEIHKNHRVCAMLLHISKEIDTLAGKELVK